MSEIRTILDFLALAERLKCELRHSWLSNGRQESVAEHSWQMALMAMLMHRHLERPVDLGKTLKKFKVPAREQKELVAILAPLKKDIVER